VYFILAQKPTLESDIFFEARNSRNFLRGGMLLRKNAHRFVFNCTQRYYISLTQIFKRECKINLVNVLRGLPGLIPRDSDIPEFV
jgi:hypothetical protein